MLDTCTLAVFGAMNSTDAISLLLRPAAMSRRTSRSRLVSAARTAPSPWLFRGSDPGPAGEVVERPAQRPGPELVRRLRRLAPLFRGLVPAARLGERLGQPPAGPGYLVDIIRTELVQDRLPCLRVVVAAGPAVLRLGPGEPAASLGAEDELGPLAERRALTGDLSQLAGCAQLGGRGLLVAGGPRLDRPVSSRAQGDRGRPDD